MSPEDMMEQHEKLCEERMQHIKERLDAGSKKMNRLEMQIWGVYVVVILSVALPQFMG
tara:strand:- start:382 stop:555 length:174 start_codon:yes stop_codon:yes gene_type:complete